VQSLVNDTSAQAIILPDNPEEPYAGNIIYNCIVPSKGFQPLQYLSGGEKSLASLALLFAIQWYHLKYHLNLKINEMSCMHLDAL